MKTLQHEVPAVSQALTTSQWKFSTQIFVMWIFNFRNKNYWGIWDFNEIFGNFQTSLTQFLEGVRTNQRYHDDRTDVLVLSAKSDRNLRFRIWDVNEDFESEISMKILKCCFFPKNFNKNWNKIPFSKILNFFGGKSHFIENPILPGET